MVNLRANKTPKKEPQISEENEIKTLTPQQNGTKKRSQRNQGATPVKKSKLATPKAEPDTECGNENIQEVSNEIISHVAESSPTRNTNEATSDQVNDGKTILVKNVMIGVTADDLRALFGKCGEIEYCQKCVTNIKTAIIKFKTSVEADCAVATQNGQVLHKTKIGVALLNSLDTFSKKNRVVLEKLPSGSPLELYTAVRKAMSVFGNILQIKFAPDQNSAKVLFEKSGALAAALKAGSIELLDTQVAITSFSDYVSPDTMVILYGLADGTSKETIRKSVSEHPFVSIILDKGTSGKRNLNQAILQLENEEAAEKMLNLQTLDVNKTIVDILPHYNSKKYYNVATKTYYRHPGGIFVENIQNHVDAAQITSVFREFGSIQKVLVRHRFAIVIFESAVGANKALERNDVRLHNHALSLHAIDGSYKPGDNTLCFSNVTDISFIPELAMILKSLKLPVGFVCGYICPLTRQFGNAAIVPLDNAYDPKELFDLEVYLGDQLLTIEMFDSNKCRTESAGHMVMLQNLNQNVKEMDIWKALQSFGEIKTVLIYKDSAYVHFAKPEFVEKALASSTVEIKGTKFTISKMTSELLQSIGCQYQMNDGKHNEEYKSKSPKFAKKQHNFKSLHGVMNKPTFKKKTRRMSRV